MVKLWRARACSVGALTFSGTTHRSVSLAAFSFSASFRLSRVRLPITWPAWCMIGWWLPAQRLGAGKAAVPGLIGTPNGGDALELTTLGPDPTVRTGSAGPGLGLQQHFERWIFIDRANSDDQRPQ